MPSKPGIGTLIRFARLASEGRKESIILPALADVLVSDVAANAVAILQIQGGGGARFLPSPHLPPELASFNVEDEDPLDSELERRVLSCCGQRFGTTCTRPMVAGEGLFGSVTLFFTSENGCSPEQLELAEGLIDLAAMSLAGIARLSQLAESHAELRASQERLIRSEKMRALGEMAAGVSHDLKNILNPLSLQMQLAHRRIEQGRAEEAAKCLAEMKQVLARGVQTIDRLRDYGRQSPERPQEAVDLAHVAREASEIARPRIAERGTPVRYRFEEEGPALVRGLSGEIVSAVVNLTVNAIDAMTTAGTITFRSGSKDGAHFIEVADDGPGMTPEIERRVFEPFFSTKGDQGTGLGLAMVYACMKRHGGKVSLTTAPGQGTTFRLSFPVASSIPPPPPAL